MKLNAPEYYRKKKNLTFTKLGNQIDMHPSNISMVERGQRKAWGNMKRKLATALEVTEEQLFDEEGNVRQMNIELKS
nr:helix-turn-helix transcriptional regulator [Neobacillus sp. Marseille-Q6967]